MDRETTRRELIDWIGGTAALTDAQMDRLIDASLDIDERFPDPDEQRERDAALSAALQYLLGETTPAAAGEELRAARIAEERAFVAAVQTAVMAVRVGGMPKATAAREAGVDRMQVLKALGERE